MGRSALLSTMNPSLPKKALLAVPVHPTGHCMCRNPADGQWYIFRTRHPFIWLLLLFVSSLWTFLHLWGPRTLVVEAQGNDTNWHQYVRAPPSRIVSPQAILSQYTEGNVSNPDAIINGGNLAYLTRKSNSSAVPAVVVDFGQNVVGQLTIDFAGSQTFSEGDAGIRLIFSETLQFLTDRSDFTRSDNGETPDLKIVPSGTDQIAVDSQPYTWIDQWGCKYGNQVCSDGLHGFRYVKITLDALADDAPYTSSEGYVAISSVGLQFSGYLGTPDTFAGWFECSDANLTQWWYDGSYTTEMGTDVFRSNDTEPRGANSSSLIGKLVLHDGAKRDRDPYVGDLAVSALTSYLTHDVHEAARNVMEDLIQHQRSDGWIPPASIRDYELPLFDYPLWWVSSSWDYVYYSGNLSYLESYYSNLQSVLDNYYPANTANNSLLLRPDGYGDYAFLSRPGSAAYYSALYVLALNRAADLADLLSQSSDSDRWRQRALSVSESFANELWDPSVGAFFDRKCNDTGCDAHTQDGNSIAILSGIIDSNSTYAASALSYLSSANTYPYGNSFYDAGGDSLSSCDACSQRVYAFISYFEIAARFETGSVSSALDQIRRMYGWMASQDPGVTMWEGIGAGGIPYEGADTSMAHGWSTGIVPLLSNYVLGVKPIKPGFQEWVVRPYVGDLTWARGEVPTPYGGLNVSWEYDEEQGTFQASVEAPNGTVGTVGVPYDGGQQPEISVDGEVVWDGKGLAEMGAVLADGFVSVRVDGGKEHVIGYKSASESKR
ncbi:Six-hairpin glycosidase-like protein [Xylariales sp. AK1849]|nr:Six-hairpin glycosidase-like protein [Xylariales sp. AK1849]